jgi:dihydroflavonol-4-reductase
MEVLMITNKPICVTGASGFIASYVICELLDNGYTVRGTVRGLTGGKNYEYLTSLTGAAERLELMQAELLTEGSYDEAIAGCEYVIHTASPYVLDVKDPQHDLVDPALKGTMNVLQACAKAGSVKKVVLTSSVAAVFDEPVSGHVYTEEDWNETSSLTRNPYFYSKTLAERSAWEYVEKKNPAFELVVVNPGMVIGPSLVPSLNTSNQIFRDVLAGTYPMIMSISWGFVDVRDVAHAHVLAMENEKAKGRYLCTSETLSMSEVVSILREAGYSNYKLPKMRMTGKVGNALVKILVSTRPKGVRTFVRTHVGRSVQYNNTKIREELGMTFHPVKESIREAVEDLLRWKHVS